jgi:hypothetical protein
MVVKVHTQLPTSADHAWRVLSRHDTFPYAARGALCYTDAGRYPEELHEGQEIQTRILFFHLIPAWRHHLRLVRVDEKRREILSQERGGFIGAWNHRIRIEPENTVRCRYTDEIEIRAGIVTPLVWAFTHLSLRYRQLRFRRLIQWLVKATLLRR